MFQLDLYAIILDAEESGMMLQHLCDRLCLHQDFCVAWIGLVNYADHELRCSYASDRADPRFLPQIHCIAFDLNNPGLNDPAALAVLNERTILIEQTQSDPRFSTWKSRAKFSRIASYIALPLQNEHLKRPIGVLCIGSEQPISTDSSIVIALEALVRRTSTHLHRVETHRHLTLAHNHASKQAQTLQRLLDALPMGVFWKDTHLRYGGANHTFWRNYLGRNSADAIGKTDEELGWALGTPQLSQQEREILFQSQSCVNQFEPHAKRWMLSNRVLLCDTEGQPQQLLGVMIDTTQFYQHYRLMQTQNQQLSKLIGLLPYPICAYDPRRKIKLWNYACELLFGFTPKEALDQKIDTLLMTPPQNDHFIAKLDAWLTLNRPMSDGVMRLKGKTIPSIERYATHHLLDRMGEHPLIVSMFTEKMTN